MSSINYDIINFPSPRLMWQGEGFHFRYLCTNQALFTLHSKEGTERNVIFNNGVSFQVYAMSMINGRMNE